MSNWQVIDAQSTPLHPEENMQADYERLLNFSSQPILHFHGWEKGSLTFGYFTNPDNYLVKEAILEEKIVLAKRPTGGGIILHDYDLSFSLIIPSSHPWYALNTLKSYQKINSRLALALREFDPTLQPYFFEEQKKEKPSGFCMLKPTVYDLLIDGRKAAGAAQRRTKHALLHHGSICLSLPPEELLKKILKCEKINSWLMIKNSYPLFQNRQEVDLCKLKCCIIKAFDL